MFANRQSQRRLLVWILGWGIVAAMAVPVMPCRAAGLLIADGGFGGVLAIQDQSVHVTIKELGLQPLLARSCASRSACFVVAVMTSWISAADPSWLERSARFARVRESRGVKPGVSTKSVRARRRFRPRGESSSSKGTPSADAAPRRRALPPLRKVSADRIMGSSRVWRSTSFASVVVLPTPGAPMTI